MVASEVATVVDEAVETVGEREVVLGAAMVVDEAVETVGAVPPVKEVEALESLQARLALAERVAESRMQSPCSFAHKTHLRPFRVQSDCDTNACCHQAT